MLLNTQTALLLYTIFFSSSTYFDLVCTFFFHLDAHHCFQQNAIRHRVKKQQFTTETLAFISGRGG